MAHLPMTIPSELARTVDDVEKEHVLRVIDAFGGNRTAAARVLEIDRTTLHRKLQRWAALVTEM